MRKSLIDLIKNTIIFEYHLPHSEKCIDKVNISTEHDKCFSAKDIESIKKIIYNSIIEYSFNEFELEKKDFENLHSRALQTKIKYQESASLNTKKKYGFFGEVLLYSMLHVFFDVPVLISRGYFYNPLENSETKGYDAYHLIERDKTVDLWFGEVKFHKNYESGIDSVFKNIEKALSDDYFNKNILAIMDYKNNLNNQNTVINSIISNWENNPSINIAKEMDKYNIKLIYPVLVLYEGINDYDQSIKSVSEYINKKYRSISTKMSLNYSIFFIFLPLKEVGKIKSDVISWIETKKQLML